MTKYNYFKSLSQALATIFIVINYSLTPALANECKNNPFKEFTPPLTVKIPAGKFIQGSDKAEREIAYILDEVAYGHSVTRDSRWYSSEFARQENVTPRYSIMKTPVTNEQYQQFVTQTCHTSSTVTAAEWASYGLNHSYVSTQKLANKRWIVKGGSWDDKGCGVCRSSARHSRPEAIKHILVGFRLLLEE